MYTTRPPELGFAPAVAIAVVGSLPRIARLLGFQSSDPARDQERVNRIDVAFQAAMAGDPTPITTNDPNSNLEGATGPEYLEYIATNNGGHPERPGPGTAAATTGAPVYGSTIALRYAQQKWGEYQAARPADAPRSGADSTLAGFDPKWLLTAAVGLVIFQLFRR